MDDPLLIERMRSRARQLRRMSEMAHDPRIVEMLCKVAGEIEADVARLEAEAGAEAQRG
jgi:hypothetical protein